MKTEERRGIAKFVPILHWLPRYDKADLGPDVIAGLTTAVMLIPQAMAYALLAGLPAYVGLYAAAIPLVAYAVLGTSRPLGVGPVAMDSLLTASTVGAIAAADPAVGEGEYILLATVLAFMAGGVQIALGLLRFGFVVNLLSRPVVAGFTSAAALIIGLSQLKLIIGVDLPRTTYVHEIVINAAQRVGEINGVTLGIGVAAIVALILLKKYAKKFPRALAVVVVGAAAVIFGGLEEMGVSIIGAVPEGMPGFSLPAFGNEVVARHLPGLIGPSITIALVAFMEAISVAKGLARQGGGEPEPNQELIALGTANVLAGVFKGYPVTGGFSRSAVNASAGARTHLAGLITAAVVAITLLFFTPLLYSIPKAALGAIIMTAVFGLIDIAEMKKLWKTDRQDLALMGITFAATLSIGIQQGILVGVAAGIAAFVLRATAPHIALLGEIEDMRIYRNVKRYDEAKPTPGVVAIRIDAQWFFGNVTFLRNALREFEAQMDEELRAIVIDASAITGLDSTAADALGEIFDEYHTRGVRLVLAAVRGPVRDKLEITGLQDRFGEENLTTTMREAMASVREWMAQPSEREPDSSSKEEDPAGVLVPASA